MERYSDLVTLFLLYNSMIKLYYLSNWWVRASFPRIRYDQLMTFCWTVLLPILFWFIILVPLILNSFEGISGNLTLLVFFLTRRDIMSMIGIYLNNIPIFNKLVLQYNKLIYLIQFLIVLFKYQMGLLDLYDLNNSRSIICQLNNIHYMCFNLFICFRYRSFRFIWLNEYIKC